MFRWIIYDLEYQEADGRKVSKICYIMYSPDDNADNTEKFVVACNKDQVKSKVSEVNRDFQINRWDDLIEENFIKAFNNWAIWSMPAMDWQSSLARWDQPQQWVSSRQAFVELATTVGLERDHIIYAGDWVLWAREIEPLQMIFKMYLSNLWK